jgi:hypothetical protein
MGMTKIQELADQAKLSIPQGMYEPDAWIREYNRRFAELIVNECIDIAYREGDNVAYLALHFGVER